MHNVRPYVYSRPCLNIICNNILTTGIFPDVWKKSNILSIIKKEDKQLSKNDRPISLLPILCKIFEKLLFKNLYNYFHSNNLIAIKQSGFCPGDSNTNQLIELATIFTFHLTRGYLKYGLFT